MKYVYSALTLLATFNLGYKLYTHDSGPLVNNYLASCLIGIFVMVYLGFVAFDAWTKK